MWPVLIFSNFIFLNQFHRALIYMVQTKKTRRSTPKSPATCYRYCLLTKISTLQIQLTHLKDKQPKEDNLTVDWRKSESIYFLIVFEETYSLIFLCKKFTDFYRTILWASLVVFIVIIIVVIIIITKVLQSHSVSHSGWL